MPDQDYSIQNLCDKTGLPRRTIHFYTQQGLLPPPNGAGPGARYDDRHLLRLQLIPLLRQQGLRLDQIRMQLLEADLPAMHTMREKLAAPPAPPTSEPAMQPYLHYLLPGGVLLAAPANLPPAGRKKLADLLEAARRIFGSTLIEPPSTEL